MALSEWPDAGMILAIVPSSPRRHERGRGGYFHIALPALTPIHLAARVRPSRGLSAAIGLRFGLCRASTVGSCFAAARSAATLLFALVGIEGARADFRAGFGARALSASASWIPEADFPRPDRVTGARLKSAAELASGVEAARSNFEADFRAGSPLDSRAAFVA